MTNYKEMPAFLGKPRNRLSISKPKFVQAIYIVAKIV